MLDTSVSKYDLCQRSLQTEKAEYIIMTGLKSEGCFVKNIRQEIFNKAWGKMPMGSKN